mgnify:CR=1 FL=1|tara:strand:- start:429 stop:974 length:546 start_codon:yes stop_codon:yes gene_type:complete
MLARMANGAVDAFLDMTIDEVPPHKRDYHLPVIDEGDGPTLNIIIEADRVRRVRSQPSPTVNHIIAERSRRLQLGFDYDFGMMEDGVTPDPRGIHTIGTTEADWVGWNEVINLANALIDVGDTESTIDIVTDTGPASVTAPEWQAIMLAGAADRQVIWAKSFELQTMDPIPENFEDDSFWS